MQNKFNHPRFKTYTGIVLLALLGVAFCSHAQPNEKKDSLAALLQKSNPDTNKVMLLLHYGETFENSQPDTALFYYEQAKTLADKLQYKKGLSTYTSFTIVILNNRGEFTKALELCRQNLSRWEGSGNAQELAVAHINIGSEWQYLSHLETAARSYIVALQYANQINQKRLQRIANNNLASIFASLGQYQKALEYGKQALQIAQTLQNDYAIASSLINIATAESQLKQYDSALMHFQQVERLGQKMNDTIIQMDGWLGQADNLKALQNWNKAESLYKKTISRAEQIGAPEYALFGYIGLGDLLLKTKVFAAADTVIQLGIELARQLGTRLELKELFLNKSRLYELTGKPAEALRWYQKFVLLSDSLLNEKNIANINLQEIEFKTAQKQAQINGLETAGQLQIEVIKRKNRTTALLATIALALLVVVLLGYRSYLQKQQLQQQRILQLESEKQLLAAAAVLKGQEAERNRLAKDLHDGLGGMLSGVKHSFANMKHNMIMTPETMLGFERGLGLLDASIGELRRVAQAMMPETLVKFGLNAALRDFCTSINSSGALAVVYQSHGLDSVKLEPTVSVTIYRVVQELLTNAMKHAAASQAIVQLNLEAITLSITVEDDGKGFDTAVIAQAKGMGWANVQSRLNYLGARLDLQTAPGKGTSVHIEIGL